MKRIALTLALSCSLLGGLGSFAMAQDAAAVPPDNTAVNARDRAPDVPTADRQSNGKSDVELTRKIRRAVVKDRSLSTLAHNVKIVSENGNVTLRGPVKSEEEKTTIASKAQAIAGPDKVENQLEVKNE